MSRYNQYSIIHPSMITSTAAAEVGAPDDDKSLIIFQDNEAPADELAFDEMNLVELPFALLTRDTRGVFEIPLSADGKSRLAVRAPAG
ncbi:MAG: hypothetical protein IT386_18285 [Deltaproteobacteria bacterium]|nr:hypothetical protein [Deltaproteobacteria bacterium]